MSLGDSEGKILQEAEWLLHCENQAKMGYVPFNKQVDRSIRLANVKDPDRPMIEEFIYLLTSSQESGLSRMLGDYYCRFRLFGTLSRRKKKPKIFNYQPQVTVNEVLKDEDGRPSGILEKRLQRSLCTEKFKDYLKKMTLEEISFLANMKPNGYKRIDEEGPLNSSNPQYGIVETDADGPILNHKNPSTTSQMTGFRRPSGKNFGESKPAFKSNVDFKRPFHDGKESADDGDTKLSKFFKKKAPPA